MSRRAFLLVLPAAAALSIASAQLDVRAESPSTDRDAARVELGRRLFFDPAIGRQGKVGCASCHDPEHGFSDPRVKSLDETGELPRHSQPLTDLAGEGFHWDGEFDTVRQLVETRVLSRGDAAVAALERTVARAERAAAGSDPVDAARLREQLAPGLARQYYGDRQSVSASVTANVSDGEVLASARLARSGVYAKGFDRSYGTPDPTLDRIVDSIDAYVRSLRTEESPFDRFLAGNDRALGAAARRGFALFTGSAGCAQCHSVEPVAGRARLTDGQFHDTGVAWDAGGGAFTDRGAGAPSMRPRSDGRFKTPSLRDVARRAPYMHDGRFANLEQVVRYYDAGGTPHAVEGGGALDSRIRPLGLSDGDVKDLVAFLESLSGRDRAGLGAPARDRPKTLRVRVVDLEGARQARVTVVVRTAGDRLRGANAGAGPRKYVTDDAGEARITWPLATHVDVGVEGMLYVAKGLVPDYVDAIELTVVGAGQAVYSLPTGICEHAATLVGRSSGASAPPITLRLVQELKSGRSLYVAKTGGHPPAGRYELTKSATGAAVGTYDLDGWKWTPDATELAGRFPAAPTSASIPDGLAERIRALTTRSK